MKNLTDEDYDALLNLSFLEKVHNNTGQEFLLIKNSNCYIYKSWTGIVRLLISEQHGIFIPEGSGRCASTEDLDEAIKNLTKEEYQNYLLHLNIFKKIRII